MAKKCSTCDGTGSVAADPPREIDAKTGKQGKEVKFEALGEDGKMHQVDTPGPRRICPACNGEGK